MKRGNKRKVEEEGGRECGVREGGIRGKEGEIAERKIQLYPPCKHLQMNYLDTDSLLPNTKHLINI